MVRKYYSWCMSRTRERLSASLAAAKEARKNLDSSISELENRLRFARGTRGIVAPEGDVPPHLEGSRPVARCRGTATSTTGLLASIMELLRAELMSVQDLASALDVPVGPVADLIRELRQERRVWNVGTEDAPLWLLRMEQATSMADLGEIICRLIAVRPMTEREIVEATGARIAWVKSALADIERTDQRVLKIRTGRVKRWMLPPQRVARRGTER